MLIMNKNVILWSEDTKDLKFSGTYFIGQISCLKMRLGKIFENNFFRELRKD